jgi:large-conductance mechanosensitive channel
MIYIRYILRLLKPVFGSFGRTLKQLIGMIIFVLIAALETGDWSGIMSRYGNPSSDALSFGISIPTATNHLLIQMILAIFIILASLITALGFMRDESWVVKSSQATGVVFVVYGLYQIYSGLSIVNSSQEGIILAGAIYVLIGFAVFGLGSKFAGRPKPQPRTTVK